MRAATTAATTAANFTPPVVSPTVAAATTTDDPLADPGRIALRAQIAVLVATQCYWEAWRRRDLMTMARWHRNRRRYERELARADAVFQATREGR